MGSSKEPGKLTLVPESIIALSRSPNPANTVFCNLRPEQRTTDEQSTDYDRRMRNHPSYGDGEMIGNEFELFLSRWRRLATKAPVVMLYQDYNGKMFTVVVMLEPDTFWTEDGLARLEFDKPGDWNQCPNMWGVFVLAIAAVNSIRTTRVTTDPNAEHFIQLVKESGKPFIMPIFRSGFLFAPLLSQFSKFDRGEIVDQLLPAIWLLQPGDQLEWEAGCNLVGLAKIVECEQQINGGYVRCTIKKVS